MRDIEIVEPERDESWKWHYADSKQTKSLFPKGKNIVACGCRWGDTCLNDKEKKLIGSFNLCVVTVINE